MNGSPQALSPRPTPATDPKLPHPVFIIGCNRSGTTLLFNTLSGHPAAWSWYIEAQEVFHRHYPVDDAMGERVTAPPSPAVARSIRDALFARAHNKEYFADRPLLGHIPRKMLQRQLNPLYKPGALRLVEKTPANSLRIPLLEQLFPDARYLFLVRRGEDVVSSLMEGWKNWSAPRTGPERWFYTRWHYLIPPDWRAYIDRPLEEICAFQWIEATRTAWNDLQRHCQGRFLRLRHEDLVAQPQAEYRKILHFCDFPASTHFDRLVSAMDRRIYTTGGSAPRKEKWRSLHGAEIERIRDRLAPVNALFYGDQDGC